MFLVPACSGLSQINRNASANSNTNVHFYRAFDIIKNARPKAFTIENAPTLVVLGYPILQKMIRESGLADDYNFTIMLDEAGRHNVAMKRRRTMIVGWRRDVFNDQIPIVYAGDEKKTFIDHVFGDLPTAVRQSNIPNHNDLSFVELYDYVPETLKYASQHRYSHKVAMYHYFKENVDHFDRVPEKLQRYLRVEFDRIDSDMMKWDKSAKALKWGEVAPSMTSLTTLIHPSGDRPVSNRELARLMGFKDDFVFHEGGKAPIIQCLAQGVPAKFVKWVATECKGALENDGRPMLAKRSDGHQVVFQDNIKGVYYPLTGNDVDELTELKAVNFPNRKQLPTRNDMSQIFE